MATRVSQATRHFDDPRDTRPEPPSYREHAGAARERIDVRNTWQVVAGSILVPIGVALILVAWYGTAHTRFVQQQIPYLVSGSFAGLGCMILGGLLYWAHWLYRIFDQSDQHHEETLNAMFELLQSSRATPSARPTSQQITGREPHLGNDVFLATGSGSVFHRLDCPVVRQRTEDVRVLQGDETTGMDPCRICTPDRER